MDPSNLLSQLRDIHSPEPISVWPLAAGWWLVIILSITTLITLSYYLFKRRLNTAWKRQAVKAFQALKAEYIEHPSSENLLKINRLLKQALATSKRDRVYLQLCESNWAEALLSVKHKNSSILRDEEVNTLSKAIYTREISSLDKAALERISFWIKSLG